jgi:oligopeptide transport system ATP-binding protein
LINAVIIVVKEMSAPLLLSVKNIKVEFEVNKQFYLPWQKKETIKAVDGVSFNLNEGETLGIVGETGCGKSSLARAIIKMIPVKSGKVIWRGEEIFHFNKIKTREMRKQIQMIFQDPLASLNPRMNIGEIIAEPLRTHFPDTSKIDIKNAVSDMMKKVGLLSNLVNRYPHEFSGGQCQRIGIARALILNPKLIICDEPVSALDVSIQGQVINLLKSLQKELKLSLIFITHDLSIAKHISDNVLVLYYGKTVEMNTSKEIFSNPQHQYTKKLISSIPTLKRV